MDQPSPLYQQVVQELLVKCPLPMRSSVSWDWFVEVICNDPCTSCTYKTGLLYCIKETSIAICFVCLLKWVSGYNLTYENILTEVCVL